MQRVKYKPPEEDLADGTAEADAEKAVRAASKIAEAAVSKAVQAAALAGLEYRPPPDMQLDTPRVAKVDARQIERKAQAAQQSMARRAHRLEKAQAAATQAHLAAVGRQSSLQKEQHTQPARASLQQMLQQNKDQIHQAFENSPPRHGQSRRHAPHAAPASSTGRPTPAGAGAATRDAASKPHPAHRNSEPSQRPRTQLKAQPQSPPAPTLSASMNPAIHAKLQQAHNKLLAQSTRGYPSRQEDTAGMSARPTAGKPASRKGRAAAQPEPAAEDAWEEPPPRQMLLRMRDVQAQLQDKWLQLYWPDDSRWWPAQVTHVNPKRHRALLLYETGEEEDLDLGKMVRESEVAWLHKADMPASGSGSGHAEHAGQAHQQGWHAQRQAPHSPDQGPAAARKRKQPPASRSASAHPDDAARHLVARQSEQGHVAGRGQAVTGEEEGSSSGSLDHPGLAAPRRQRAAGGRPAAALASDLPKNRQAAGAASRQPSGNTTSMQHGLEAIFRLGNEAVGRNVHVFQSEAGSWYNAHIKQCRPRQGLLSVQYESGDQDTLKAKDEQKSFNIRLMPLSARRP
ncbi:hypothetical protein ABBQ38_004212 [Trebouxia sp. C0009 RCD-2024]